MAEVKKIKFDGSFIVEDEVMYGTSLGIYSGVDFNKFKYWRCLSLDRKIEPEKDELAIIFVPSGDRKFIYKYFQDMYENRHMSEKAVANDMMKEIQFRYNLNRENIGWDILEKLNKDFGKEKAGELFYLSGHYLILDGLMEKYPDGSFPYRYSICKVDLN